MNGFDVKSGRRVELVDVTAQVQSAVAVQGVSDGAVLVFVPHTTAGVTVNEDADPSVRGDIAMTLARLVPSDLPFTHAEGNSDAHVKASLVGSSVLVPLAGGHLQLGRWQGIYFAEFDGPRRRHVLVSVLAGA